MRGFESLPHLSPFIPGWRNGIRRGLKILVRKDVWVRIPLPAPKQKPRMMRDFCFCVLAFEHYDTYLFYSEDLRLFAGGKPDIHLSIVSGVHAVFYYEDFLAKEFRDFNLGPER